MPKQRSKQEWLEIVQDNGLACVDRGEAIVELVQFGMRQAEIAESTKPKLSTAAISHLKTCFRNLQGDAREMCKAGKMNGDACYSLASASDRDRDRIFQCAIKIRAIKDTQRSAQHKGSKGRQTPQGQITDADLKEAIEGVKHEPRGRTLGGRRANGQLRELGERDVPLEILAELRSEKLKAQQEEQRDEQADFQQVKKEEERKLKRGDHKRKTRTPRNCIEARPTAQSIHFAGEYINLAAAAVASGFGANQISGILSGRRKLTLDAAQKISAALGMGLEDFISALDRQAALQHALEKRGLTDAEIRYTIAEGWRRGFEPPELLMDP